jgi:hypothetical protein
MSDLNRRRVKHPAYHPNYQPPPDSVVTVTAVDTVRMITLEGDTARVLIPREDLSQKKRNLWCGTMDRDTCLFASVVAVGSFLLLVVLPNIGSGGS